MQNALSAGETVVHFERRHAVSVAPAQRVAATAMHPEIFTIALDKIADAIAQQRHDFIRQGRHHEFADAVFVRVDDFVINIFIGAAHFAGFVFNEQMTGFGRAVKVENRHAENALQNFAMHHADKFVAAQNEFDRRKPDSIPLAKPREPHAVNRIKVEKLRRPLRDFVRHAREFVVREQERNARLIHEQSPAERARRFGHEVGKTDHAVANRRHQRRSASGRMRVQNGSDEAVQPQHALLLRVPPAACEQHRRPLVRGAGGVFKFHGFFGEQRIQFLTGAEKIVGEITADFALGDERQARKISGQQRVAIKRHLAPAWIKLRQPSKTVGGVCRFRWIFSEREHSAHTDAPCGENFQWNHKKSNTSLTNSSGESA